MQKGAQIRRIIICVCAPVLGQMDKPDVDTIEGLSPAISIDQNDES